MAPKPKTTPTDPQRDEIRELSAEVRGLRATIKDEREARRFSNRVIAVLGSLMAIVLLVVAVALVHANEAKADARVAACIRSNQTVDDNNAALGKYGLPPLFKHRSCTPAAIRMFYSQEHAKESHSRTP